MNNSNDLRNETKRKFWQHEHGISDDFGFRGPVIQKTNMGKTCHLYRSTCRSTDLVASVFLGRLVAYGNARGPAQKGVEVGVLQDRLQVAVSACHQTHTPVEH